MEALGLDLAGQLLGLDLQGGFRRWLEPPGPGCSGCRPGSRGQPHRQRRAQRRWRPVRWEYAFTVNSLYSHETHPQQGQQESFNSGHHRCCTFRT